MHPTANKYILYVRKSSEAEDRQVASAGDQVAELVPLAKRLGLNIVEIIEEAKSAKSPGRDKFNEMVRRINSGEIDGIICWKINRLARNSIDGGQIIYLLQEGKIKHIQCYNNSHYPTDNLVPLYVEFGVANQFIKDQSMDVKRGMRRKAARGWWPTLLPPGYVHIKQNKYDGTKEGITISEENKKKLKSLWRIILKGNRSIKAVHLHAKLLDMRTHKGSPISYSTLYAMLSNEFYCGYYHWNNEQGIRERIKGKHDPVITENEFKQVQEILADKKKPIRNKTRLEFDFNGMIRCGACERAIVGQRKVQYWCAYCKIKYSGTTSTRCPECDIALSQQPKRKAYKVTYYGCAGRKYGCKSKFLEESQLKMQLLTLLSRIELTHEFILFYALAMQNIESNDEIAQASLESQLKKRIQELENRKSNYAIMRADNEIQNNEYQEFRRKVEKDLDEVQYQFSLIRDSHEVDNELKKMSRIASKCIEITRGKSNEARRSLFHEIGSNPTLIDKKLDLSIPKPFISLKNCEEVYYRNKDGVELSDMLNYKGDSIESHYLNHQFSELCAALKQTRTVFLSHSQDTIVQKLIKKRIVKRFEDDSGQRSAGEQ